LIFDSISDRFGRKWPLVGNLLFCCIFELATGFTQTFGQFLALRALFGIAMVFFTNDLRREFKSS
jgi:SHS family lactate transporter-like MFS transporter